MRLAGSRRALDQLDVFLSHRSDCLESETLSGIEAVLVAAKELSHLRVRFVSLNRCDLFGVVDLFCDGAVFRLRDGVILAESSDEVVDVIDIQSCLASCSEHPVEFILSLVVDHQLAKADLRTADVPVPIVLDIASGTAGNHGKHAAWLVGVLEPLRRAVVFIRVCLRKLVDRYADEVLVEARLDWSVPVSVLTNQVVILAILENELLTLVVRDLADPVRAAVPDSLAILSAHQRLLNESFSDLTTHVVHPNA